MRVFLDANVLFSAAKSDGAVRQLLREARRLGHECWADGYVVAEARRNLVVKGPEAVAALDTLLASIRVASAAPMGVTTSDTAWLPADDRPVLAAALRLGCEALVTGDRTHFGARYGRVVGGVIIHSPRSLADSLGIR
jgi:hypothetical protein